MLTNKPCPKCGQTMHGPKWSDNTNDLHWWCLCGYRFNGPPLDHKIPAPAGWAKLMELIAERDRKEPKP